MSYVEARSPGSPPTPWPQCAAQQTPPRLSTRPGPGCITPEAKAQLTTPPLAPGKRKVALESEIAAAVRERSAPNLKLALHHGHWCGGSHLVFEAVRRGHCGALGVLLEAGSQGVD